MTERTNGCPARLVVRRLTNGLRVVMEAVPHVRSAAIGCWMRAGSRDESETQQGVSHFVEHLLFKGTARRSARQIAEVMDQIGGQLNAFTTKEYTCYHARVLDEHLPVAVDVLADMIRCSSFREDDVAREKQVIEEEIGMYEDTPDELVHDLFAQTIWQGHPLGRPVLGTRETVNALSRQDILAHFAATCTPLDSVLAVAGSFDQQQVLALLEEGFGGWASAGARAANPPPRPEVATALRPKDTELVHVCLGGPGLPLEHAGIYPLNLMSNILGGGPSSRLFQEIREERGLAYSVFSYTSAFRDSGIFAIYCGAGKERIQTAMRVLGDELRRIGREGVGDVELSRAKEQLKSNLTMALESTAARMNRIGRSELLLERVVPIDEVLDRIGRVTVDEIRRVADEFCDPERLSLAAIGPDLERLELRPALLGA